MDEQNRVTTELEHGETPKKSHHGKRRHRSKYQKIKKFIKSKKQLFKKLAMLLVAIIAVVALGLLGDRQAHSGNSSGEQGDNLLQDPQTTEKVGTLQIEVSHFSQEVRLVDNEAQSLSLRDLSVPLQNVIERYKDKERRLDVGYPVTISYKVNQVPKGLTVVETTLEVADNPQFQDARVFVYREVEKTTQVYHLKTGTQYYYRVGVKLSDKTTTYTIGTFKTEETTRILSIEGIANVRDVGGRETLEGKTVRQGLLYRGSEMDGAVNPAFSLTESGKTDMLTILGIRTDMDLRSPADNMLGTHPLGANVSHIYYRTGGYASIFEEAQKEPIRQVFLDLAKASRYPVYLHCTYGADRTGTICYLLELLLGVSQEDALRDYELSALYYFWADSEAMNEMISLLTELPGDTMQQKVENYLLSIGVTSDEISSIRSILLEE